MRKMVRNGLMLCCCCLFLVATNGVKADPVGIKTVVKTDDPNDPAFSCNADFNVDVCNVYVEFDSADDNLLSAGFSAVSTDAVQLFQVPAAMGGANTAPSDLFIGIFPELLCDSYVTINLKTVPIGGSDCTDTDPDFDGTVFNTPAAACAGGVNNGMACLSDADCPMGECANAIVGGWFCTNPPSGQGNPDPDTLQVLIAQLSVQRGFTVGGTTTIFFNTGEVPFVAEFQCFVSTCSDNAECDDGNPCTQDICNPGGPGADDFGCVNAPTPGAPCDADGDACTIDACDDLGSCVNVDSVVCPGPMGECDGGQSCDPATGGCVDDPDVPQSTACEADGDLCTTDHCDGAGSCVNIGEVDCPDPSGPCDGGQSCNPQSGMCEDNPDAPMSTTCDDDGDACTNDHCDGAGNCVNIDSVDCDDMNACTDDACDPADGSCSHTPIDCNDDNACTDDSCDPASGCVNTPVVCDDGDPCTVDSCDPASGCVSTPIDCEDGDACTINECVGGRCISTPVDCDDGDDCTIDSCDPVSGCQSTLVDCNDGIDCTDDACIRGMCVSTPNDGACDDGNICTDDVCDVAAGGCVNSLAMGAQCADDGDCLATEVCVDCLCVPDVVPGDDDDDDDDDGRPGDDDDDGGLPGDDDDDGAGDDDDG